MSPVSLPYELVREILSTLLHDEEPNPPSRRRRPSFYPTLCSVALVDRLWSHLAVTLLHDHVHLSSSKSALVWLANFSSQFPLHDEWQDHCWTVRHLALVGDVNPTVVADILGARGLRIMELTIGLKMWWINEDMMRSSALSSVEKLDLSNTVIVPTELYLELLAHPFGHEDITTLSPPCLVTYFNSIFPRLKHLSLPPHDFQLPQLLPLLSTCERLSRLSIASTHSNEIALDLLNLLPQTLEVLEIRTLCQTLEIQPMVARLPNLRQLILPLTGTFNLEAWGDKD
ncbi:hypothetical protein T439DRAFT_329255 [Meredithblackwellia eburnea MCA 4105]